MPQPTDLIALFQSQLTEPFRIGLLIALFITMLRTRANTGIWTPLAIGAVFVAVVIPVTRVSGAPKAPMPTEIGVGILANIVLLAVVLGVWTLWQRLRR
ncbi:hypothetical protein [Fuscibacter oryzae]|uniref:Uncharacterized protein n=1 Tax=Fuscibacter oryzae TaxID=2803939 RepID=A0A8J7MWV8_9RHOB|nr:hypothetical protein [Fuscibacter oryzae]MBL4929239.1 hypothetical protein [Fuscibacter oryzae]